MEIRPPRTSTQGKLVLQPHQEKLLTRERRYPFYIFWGMGSGKTIGACACMRDLVDGESCLVLCDKSTAEQWKKEVTRVFACNAESYFAIRVSVRHYEELDLEEDPPVPSQFDMTIVDEAHRFRNAWARESVRMLRWISMIKDCTKVIFMSGTPIVNDPAIEVDALHRLMGSETSMRGRISYYDPRMDESKKKWYPSVSYEIVTCPMSWAQCFLYLSSRKQTFSLQLEGESFSRTRTSSIRNSYNTLLRSISNCPFEDPASSPKMREIVKSILANASKKQIVYSSRKDTGISALVHLWSQTGSPKTKDQKAKRALIVNGSLSKEERHANITTFNRSPGSVLFITDAGGQGIDLKRVDVVHIVEPSDNLQEERQIVNRAVRFKSHRKANSEVTVFLYATSFPINGRVGDPWKKVLFASGLFEKEEMRGITRRVQHALLRIIREETGGKTIDQKTIEIREEKDKQVQHAIGLMLKDCVDSLSLPFSP